MSVRRKPSGAHLGTADELEVVRVRDVGDHDRHRVAPAGQQGSGVGIRPVPEVGSDRQHVLACGPSPEMAWRTRETVDVATPAASATS